MAGGWCAVVLLVFSGCGRWGFGGVAGDAAIGSSSDSGDFDGNTAVDGAVDDGATSGDAAVPVCATTPGFVAVTAGWNFTCAIDTTTKLWCWGNNGGGQLGVGDMTPRTVPAPVAVTGWVQISASGSHACGRRTDGTLWCWGSNNAGQLGAGDTAPRSVPTQVGAASDWTWIGAAWGDAAWHGCGVRAPGTLWCWGSNAYNQLGFNGADKRTPTQVGTVTTWNKAAGGGHSGGAHTCATRTDGTLWCWGTNYNGRLGVGDLVDRSTPTQAGVDTDWSTPEAGWIHTLFLKSDGSAWYAGLGASSLTALPPGGSWIDLEGGWSDTSAGVRSDGTLWQWSSTSASSAAAGTDWAEVAVGFQYTCGLKTDQTLWCWGRNDVGQLGLGDTVARPSPTRVCTP